MIILCRINPLSLVNIAIVISKEIAGNVNAHLYRRHVRVTNLYF